MQNRINNQPLLQQRAESFIAVITATCLGTLRLFIKNVPSIIQVAAGAFGFLFLALDLDLGLFGACHSVMTADFMSRQVNWSHPFAR